MSARSRRTTEPQWTPPSEPELLVLRRQIQQAIAEADEIVAKPYEGSGWGAWDSNLGDLIDRAFGPKSPQANSYHHSGGMFASGPDRRDFYSAEAYEEARVKDRNKTMARQVEAARGALKAIDQELERRGALPVEVAIAHRDFRFVQDAAIRDIALRDHNELRSLAGEVVKARALLAGSVIEGVLTDALARRGFAPKQLEGLKFVELIDEAATAGVIQKRTRHAADSLRDLRNFVHPAVELREGRLRKVDAEAAVALMNMVLEDLTR